MFLKISNRGRLPRECLEMVGLSSKKGRSKDAVVIGQFGSGTKYAAAAALRLGIHTGITSTDARGTYYLTFASEPIQPEGYDAHQRIVYDYYRQDGMTVVSDYRHGTDRTVEAFPDWDKPIGNDGRRLFKVLREHICNAYDEDKAFRFDFVEEYAMAENGLAVIFLGDDPDFHEMLEDNPARYFKFLSGRKPLFSMPGFGEIWPKSDSRTTRLFLQGVLVDCAADENATSIFDYSLFGKDLLSEERILKSMSGFQIRMATMFARLEHCHVIRAILRGVATGNAPFEAAVLGRMVHFLFTDCSMAAWRSAAAELFGEKLALPSGNPHIDEDARQVMGYQVPTNLPDNLKYFLTYLGFPKANEVMPQMNEDDLRLVRLEDLPLKERAKFHRAYRLFAERFPMLTSFPIVFYQPLSEKMKRLAGVAGRPDRKYKDIWLAVDANLEFPPEHEVFTTLAHEARHCDLKADDIDRAFTDRADEDIAIMAYREAGHTKFPGTEIQVRRLAMPRTPRSAPDYQKEISVDVTDELEELVLADTLKP